MCEMDVLPISTKVGDEICHVNINLESNNVICFPRLTHLFLKVISTITEQDLGPQIS